jgi:hypothetical protein
VIFTPSLFSPEKRYRCPMNMSLFGGFKDGLDLSQERNILSVPGMEPGFLSFPASNGLNIPTELSPDLFQYRNFITTLMYCTSVPFVLIVVRPFGSRLFQWEDFHWCIPSITLKGCHVSPYQPISLYSHSVF